jgi:F420-non-reducing hydrogenase small subunit
MNDRPRVAIYWLGACGGCDETIVDMNEALLQAAEAVDICLWPIAMDFKYPSVRSMADGGIALSIIHGSVRNSEHEEMARLLRKKSQTVLAFGACACFGGTPGLANFRGVNDILDWVYRDAPTVVNPDGVRPMAETAIGPYRLTLPELHEKVRPLDRVIDVDYYLPGCPPPPDLAANAVFAVVEGKLPPRGSTLAPHKPLCETCPRKESKPLKIEIEEVRRIHMVEADPDRCFLAQGILCMGPATRSGCGETCMRINTPCRGCFGPVEGVKDPGAKFISGLAALLSAESMDDAAKAVDGIADLVGTCYRFTAASVSFSKEAGEDKEVEG